jgi:hypothetical protein
MLISIQQQSLQTEQKVRYLQPARQASPDPQLLLRRSGS